MLACMNRVFIASSGNPERLATLFRDRLPDFEILSSVDQLGDTRTPYAVVGRPQAGVISAIPGLELVLSLNAGVEHLLASDEIPTDVPIVRLVDEGLALGMTEWVIAEALAWHRNLRIYQASQALVEWKPRQELLARDRLVTVLGAGELGRPAVETFVAFGFRTRVWSRSGRSIAGAEAFGGDTLLDAVSGADIVVNLLPLTPETRDRLDANVFGAMAEGGFFINGARGAHVVDADLIAALDSGQLSGAALDVFRTEPLPADNAYWRHEKVLVTPHVAAPTHADIAVDEIAKSIMRHVNGEPLLNVVDRTHGY